MAVPFLAPDDDSGVMDGQGDRCRSNAASAAAYLAALKSSAAPASEKRLLIAAWTALTTACVSGAKAVPFNPSNGAITSAPGRDFATYLVAASAFYGGDFAMARGNSIALGNSWPARLEQPGRFHRAQRAERRGR